MFDFEVNCPLLNYIKVVELLINSPSQWTGPKWFNPTTSRAPGRLISILKAFIPLLPAGNKETWWWARVRCAVQDQTLIVMAAVQEMICSVPIETPIECNLCGCKDSNKTSWVLPFMPLHHFWRAAKHNLGISSLLSCRHLEGQISE